MILWYITFIWPFPRFYYYLTVNYRPKQTHHVFQSTVYLIEVLFNISMCHILCSFFHTIDMSNRNVAHNLRQQCQVVEEMYSVQAWRDCILFRCILCGNYEPRSETDKNKQNVLYA